MAVGIQSRWNDYTGYETANAGGGLNFPYYYAQVVGTTVDPNRAGSVQARICGVTDKWQDKDQPWVAPQLTIGMQQVPPKGYWLLVRFKDGDINQGMYYAMSQTKSFLPDKYKSEYPDVAVMNLGESEYVYVHNRRTHTSSITNPGNNSTVEWNAAGEVTLGTSNASDEPGSGSLAVLTEATIDVFTCTPVGASDTPVRAGSEYLRVPHISRATVDALRGSGTGGAIVEKARVDDVADGMQHKEIIGTGGTYEIPFLESPASKRRTGKRNRRIIVAATGKSPLAEFLSTYTSDGAKTSAHYLVGLGDGDPDILSELKDKSDAKNLGFIQCTDIGFDATLGSDMRGKPNIDAVSVVFYGDGKLTRYQQEKFADIVNHVRESGNMDEIEVVAYKPPSPMDSRYFTYINLKPNEGMY